MGFQPRRSGRARRQPAPDLNDVYGNRTPAQRHGIDLRTRLPPSGGDNPIVPQPGNLVAPGPAPQVDNRKNAPRRPDTPPRHFSNIEKRVSARPPAVEISYQDLGLTLPRLMQEGGAPFINYLLAQAIQPDDERDKSLPPAVSRVRDWQFQDILRLPKAQKEEWKKACHEELESLRERGVFELTDLPKGRRVVKNRWVFDIKSDGRKKARLVAKGFSQLGNTTGFETRGGHG